MFLSTCVLLLCAGHHPRHWGHSPQLNSSATSFHAHSFFHGVGSLLKAESELMSDRVKELVNKKQFLFLNEIH